MGSVVLTNSRKRPQGDQQAACTLPSLQTQRSVVHCLWHFQMRNTRSTVLAKIHSLPGDHLSSEPGGPRRFSGCIMPLSGCQMSMARSPIEAVASWVPSLFHCNEVMGRLAGLKRLRFDEAILTAHGYRYALLKDVARIDGATQVQIIVNYPEAQALTAANNQLKGAQWTPGHACDLRLLLAL